MDKKDLIQIINKKVGISKGDAEESLTVILEEITKVLSKGEEVILTGFGKFVVSKRKERMGINPQTKEKIKIPATKVPKFKSGKILKDAVK
ncbi:MAG: HU family DNA-binding protein [Minisyncoccales bacterium]